MKSTSQTYSGKLKDGKPELLSTEIVEVADPTPDELTLQELLALPDNKVTVPAVGKYLKALARMRR